MASASSVARLSALPETVACMRAPPISSSVVRSPTTISTMRGEPRYIDALPSTMKTTSQNAGMYAPPRPTARTGSRSAARDPTGGSGCRRCGPRPAAPGTARPGRSGARRPSRPARTPGCSCSSAYSVSRTIFSTVRAPHEPALTVGSFAMTQTGRPSTVPTPVTTPSAGRSPAIALARRPCSTNDPSSRSSARRSRTNSLPWRSSFSPSLSRLPRRARSAAACSSSVTATQSLLGRGSSRRVGGGREPADVRHERLDRRAGREHRGGAEVEERLHVRPRERCRRPRPSRRPHRPRGAPRRSCG